MEVVRGKNIIPTKPVSLVAFIKGTEIGVCPVGGRPVKHKETFELHRKQRAQGHRGTHLKEICVTSCVLRGETIL